MNKSTMGRAGLNSFSRRNFLFNVAGGALGTLLIPTAGSLLLTACGGDGGVSAGNTAVAKTPILSSVPNFRDVAGPDDTLAYQTSSGQKLQRGVFYRSSVFAPSAADLATLNMLGIKIVFDLRTAAEIAAAPDTLPDGAAYNNISIYASYYAGMPKLTSQEDAIASMVKAEQQYVTSSFECERLGELFTDMANSANAQVFHCSAGKDRTGWASAVLLTLVGVPQSVVIQDYLLTNIYTAASIQSQYEAIVASNGQTYADYYYPFLGVQQSFLMAGFTQVGTSYGTMENYVTNALGVSSSAQSQLKARLLG